MKNFTLLAILAFLVNCHYQATTVMNNDKLAADAAHPGNPYFSRLDMTALNRSDAPVDHNLIFEIGNKYAQNV